MHRQSDEIVSVIEQYVVLHHASLEFTSSENSSSHSTPLQGYQYRNWLLAKKAVTARLGLDGHPGLDEMIINKTAELLIPGRFEVFNDNGTTIVLDVAHNPQKMQAFAELLRLHYPTRPIIGVVSIGNNKQAIAKETLSYITPLLNEIVVTEFSVEADSSHQAVSGSTLEALMHEQSRVIPNINDAVDYAKKRAEADNAIVVVTGSFYLVSNVRDILLGRSKE